MVRDTDGGRGAGHDEQFSVRPEALTAFAETLDELAAHADNARAYAVAHADVDSSGGGLMVRLGDATIHLDDDLERVFGRLSQIAGRAAGEIRAARRTYRSLDRQAAQQLDSTYWSR